MEVTATNRGNPGRVLAWLAAVSLVAVLGWSYLAPAPDITPFLMQALPQAEELEPVAGQPGVYLGYAAQDQNRQLVGYVGLAEGAGYSGPMRVAVGMDTNGNVLKTVIVEHKETPSYMQIVLSKDFLTNMAGRPADAPFRLGNDVDKVTGATLSSAGITAGVRAAAHSVGRGQLGMNIPRELPEYKFGAKEVALLVLYGVMLTGICLHKPRMRWISLLGGLVVLGFWANAAISTGNIVSLITGSWPSAVDNLLWYLLVPGVLAITFAWRRNLYCFWLCPFGCAQELAARVGGGGFKCTPRTEQAARRIKYFLAWAAVMLAIVYNSPGMASYEPFATFFGRKGIGVQWVIVPAVLLASLFVNRYWCRYFCPVWVVMELTVKLRKAADSLLKGAIPWRKRVSQPVK